MKKKIHILSVLLFISLLPIAMFTSCDKDTNCYVDVLVVDELDRTPVSDVQVELMNYKSPHDHLYKSGVTNENGIFSTYYTAPAILNIKVKKGIRTGEGTVRLEEGITKTATVILKLQAK